VVEEFVIFMPQVLVGLAHGGVGHMVVGYVREFLA
jgi:hypothetical protein